MFTIPKKVQCSVCGRECSGSLTCVDDHPLCVGHSAEYDTGRLHCEQCRKNDDTDKKNVLNDRFKRNSR